MPRYIPQRPYSDKYTGLPGMLSAVANEGEHFRLTKTSRLQTMDARRLVQQQHLIDHPAGKEGMHVTNSATVSHDSPRFMKHPIYTQYSKPPTKDVLKQQYNNYHAINNNNTIQRRVVSSISNDAPDTFKVNYVPTTSTAANKGTPLDIVPTPLQFKHPTQPKKKDPWLVTDKEIFGVVPSPRRPEMYNDMENEVNMTFGHAEKIHELQDEILEKSKRAWRWFLHRKPGALSRDNLIDEELEAALIDNLYDLAQQPYGGNLQTFVKHVARARGPIDENNSWPMEVRLHFLKAAKAYHMNDSKAFDLRPVIFEKANDALQIGFNAKESFREHQAMVKLHAAKHSIHDAILDKQHIHDDEVARAKRLKQKEKLNRRGGGGALRRRPGYQPQNLYKKKRPHSPKFKILHRAIDVKDLPAMRAKHDADKHEQMLPGDPSARSGGTDHEHIDRSKGLKPFHVHYAPLKQFDLERIAKKREAGLHKQTSPPHHHIGHRKKDPITYRHGIMLQDPTDDHSHGLALVICKGCKGIAKRGRTTCIHCGTFLPLPFHDEHENGYNGKHIGHTHKVKKLGSHVEHEIVNDKIDYHHAREFALKHLKVQAGFVPGLDIYNPDTESLKRAHEAFNKAYAKSHTHVKKQHLTKMQFDEFKHHFEEQVGHKHRTKLFGSIYDTKFSPRVHHTKHTKHVKTIIDNHDFHHLDEKEKEFKKKQDIENHDACSPVKAYLKGRGTPDFYKNYKGVLVKDVQRETKQAKESDLVLTSIIPPSPTNSTKTSYSKRKRRLSYVGLTNKQVQDLWRKGVRAAIGVRKWQRAASHAKQRLKHIPFHTGANMDHKDHSHIMLERRSSMHLKQYNKHMPVAKIITAGAPKRHHALREVRNVDNDHHDFVLV